MQTLIQVQPVNINRVCFDPFLFSSILNDVSAIRAIVSEVSASYLPEQLRPSLSLSCWMKNGRVLNMTDSSTNIEVDILRELQRVQ